MLELEPLRREALGLDVAAFRKRYSGLYLLGTIPADLEDDWSFGTDVRGIDGYSRPTLKSLDIDAVARAVAAATPSLWPVEKSDRNDWKRRISVGRATNNDLILRHHSVSKLHAHFQHGTLARLGLGRSGELLLTDDRSQNGTFVHGKRLSAEETVPVSSGAWIRFGSVECRLLDADALHAALREER